MPNSQFQCLIAVYHDYNIETLIQQLERQD